MLLIVIVTLNKLYVPLVENVCYLPLTPIGAISAETVVGLNPVLNNLSPKTESEFSYNAHFLKKNLHYR